MGKQKWACVNIPGVALFGTANPTATLGANTSYSAGAAGKSLKQTGSAANSGLSYGANAGMLLSTSSGIIVCKNIGSGPLFTTHFGVTDSGGGFYVDLNANTARLLSSDTANILASTNTVASGQIAVIAWSYNGSTGRARIALNGVLSSATSAQTFAHLAANNGGYWSNDPSGTTPIEMALFALSPDECLSDAALVYASLHPWELFATRKRRAVAAAPSAGAFSISPNAGHTAGSITISVTYTGGATAPASGAVPFSISSGGGSISAGSWVQDSSTTGHFTFVEGAASGTATVFADGSGQSLASQSFSNAAVAPGAPTGVSVVDNHDGTVTVSFSAPADNGGSAITSYDAVSSSGGVHNTGSASPITVSSVNKGVSQTFAVTATNGVGAGSASSASSAVTPITVPGAPTSVIATAGNTSASVTGTAPADTGGGSLTYVADDGLGGHTTAAGSLPRSLTGLTNGVAITPRLAAVNSYGQGAWASAGSAVTPANTVTIMVRCPFLTSDTIGTKSAQVYDIQSGVLTAVGSAITTGFVAIPNITNGWWLPIQVVPNGAYGDFAGIVVFSNINGTDKAAVEIYSPPTSTPASLVIDKIATFLPSDTVVTPANSTVTITNASPGVITWTAHGLSNGNIIQLATTGTLPTGLSPAVAYYIVNKTTNTFQLSATSGGTAINTSSAGSGTHTAYAGPGYQLYDSAGSTLGSRVASGILAISGVTNGYATKLTLTPDAHNGFQGEIIWDGG